ncbi:MAG: aldo/keto reductase, partial [Pantoea sp. Pent]|nr:aldo/keto reductase [Pantoea sp. Pent]
VRNDTVSPASQGISDSINGFLCLSCKCLPCPRTGGHDVPGLYMGRGFLTGKYPHNSDLAEGDFRKNNAHFSQSSLDHNAQLLDAVHPLAEKYSCTPGQVAQAWLLAQYDKLIPIPGTKQTRYLVENAQVADIVLEQADIALLNAIHQHIEIRGERYSQEGMKSINA